VTVRIRNGACYHLFGDGASRSQVVGIAGPSPLGTFRRPASDPAAILAADAPWVVRMHFLREVDQKSNMGALRDGFETNSREKLAQLGPELERLVAGTSGSLARAATGG